MSEQPSDPPELSIIVPMYNEAESCDAFFETIVPLLQAIVSSYEILCINDGSTDETYERLKAARAKWPQIKLLNLSRNFGKEAAMTAGIDIASGRAVVPIDADLQDPPELLKDMVSEWRDGAHVVLAQRSDRSSDGMLKRFTANFFYRIFSRIAQPAIPQNVGDFRLMDRVVVDALKKLPERSRFMKGLFGWVGYKQVTLQYVRPPRQAGQTSFNFSRLWNFAIDGIVSFSSMPLKIWSYFGVLVSISAIGYVIYLVVRTLVWGVDVPGYASLMSALLLLNGLVLISLGAIGEYLARVFIEVKQRPVYLIMEMEGFDQSTATSTEMARSRTADPEAASS